MINNIMISDTDGFFDKIGKMYVNDTTDFQGTSAVFSVELLYQAFKKRLLEETQQPKKKRKKKKKNK